MYQVVAGFSMTLKALFFETLSAPVLTVTVRGPTDADSETEIFAIILVELLTSLDLTLISLPKLTLDEDEKLVSLPFIVTVPSQP